MLGNFSCVLSSAEFFQNHLFQKIISGILSVVSVVECLTPDRGVAGSGLTGVTAFCP